MRPELKRRLESLEAEAASLPERPEVLFLSVLTDDELGRLHVISRNVHELGKELSAEDESFLRDLHRCYGGRESHYAP